MGAVTHNFVATSRLVNEARFLVALRDQLVSALDPACDGDCDGEDEGGPTIEVAGFASLGRQRFTPTPRDNLRFQFVDTLSYSRGQHLIKAGTDFSIVNGLRQALPLHFGGRYIFTALPAIAGVFPAPVSAIQAVALGFPAAYVQGYGNSGSAYDYRDLSLFVEDAWQVHPRVGLRAGLRYERQFFPAETSNVAGMPGPYLVARRRQQLRAETGCHVGSDGISADGRANGVWSLLRPDHHGYGRHHTLYQRTG